MNVGLFVPCYIDQFYPQVAIATLELLEKLGCKVGFPLAQTCCGQPMANSGFADLAKRCDQLFCQNFQAYDYIVGPSGSCVLHLKEHGGLHPSGGIFELSEFLVDVLKVERLSATFPHRVGLHQSCHGQRGLRLSSMSELQEVPFSKVAYLLNLVQGLELKLPTRVDECCGFGGTFCVTEEAVSVKMGKDRIKEHQEQEVEFIIGTDTSCLMHLEGILRRQGSHIQVRHVAEVLNSALN